MIIYENRLLEDDSHEILLLIIFFSKIRKDIAKMLYVAVMIRALRVNALMILNLYSNSL